MVAINKPRPPPLRINKLGREISKPRIPPPPGMKQRLPIVIYTYSPKVIQTEPDNFMLLVQRLTGSTPTRQRCAQLASASGASDFNKDMCDLISVPFSQGGSSQVEGESTVTYLDDKSLPESSATELESQSHFPEQKLSGASSSTNLENFEEELMTSVMLGRNRHAGKPSSVCDLLHPPLLPHIAGEGFLAKLQSRTPSTNQYLPDMSVFPFETFESFGIIFSPCGAFTSPHGVCFSPWVPSPGSIACREMAFAILGGNCA